MIIGFDGSRAFAKHRTGTENYSYHLLKALAKIDKKNKYLIYDQKSIPLPRLWTQIGLAFRTFIDPLDILFVPAHTLPLIRKPGLKTVVTVHDLGSEYLPVTHQLKQRLYLSLMQKYQLKGATKLIAVSKATKNDLVKKIGIDPEKITVIYEGFDKKLFKPINVSKQDYFLFVGTVQPRKNLVSLIQAFATLQGGQLVIAGNRGWMADRIYALPKKLGVEERVKFLGYVADHDLPALYSGAKALLFPSLFEGFGLPILEAQACGCPVITSNVSSMPEVAGKAALFVDPYNIDDIVRGMKEINNKDTRNKLIKAGYENIKRFSWEKCARETVKIFEKL